MAVAGRSLEVNDVTELNPIRVAKIVVPRSTEEVAAAVKSWPGQIAVGGGRFSMGGQIAIEEGLHLDLRGLKELVWLDVDRKVARVQSGMRWRDLQELIDPHGLAVKTMQSFSTFTVGGAVSVNAHGRYVGNGPVGNTVRALKLVLGDGSVVEVTPKDELFRAAIGGYGAAGVITEVELDLADNVKIERVVKNVSLADYVAYFREQVLADPASVMHNADLSPPSFDAPVAVTWKRVSADRELTETMRLIPKSRPYELDKDMLWAMSELPGGAQLRRKVVEPAMLNKPVVKWLNHEASKDVAQLEPRTRVISTYVLQEYFVPEAKCVDFAKELARILVANKVNALNVSIRHSPADRVSALPWAKEDVFSFVLYFKQRTWASARETVGKWTRELIDAALQVGGRYYLPYQLHATREQFDAAYPEAKALRIPERHFTNSLWRKYL